MADNFDLGSFLGNLLAGGTDIARAFGGGTTGDIGRAREAAAVADPFAAQRPQYQEMLKGLLTNPNSFTMDPGTLFAKDQALDAAKGSSNALYGSSRAGALLPELEKIGAGYANQGYNSRIAQLLTASGATTGAPGAAGAAIAGGFDDQDRSLADAIRNLMGGGANVPGQVGSGVFNGLGSILQKIIGGGGSGFGVNPITGAVDYGGGMTGVGDQGGFVGDITDPGQGFGSIGDWAGEQDWSGFGSGDFDWGSLFGGGGAAP